MIKKIVTLVILLQGTLITFAQTEADALRYAEILPTGTARYTAMGGAFSALGGDLSTMATNPAGIGVYRKSDFGITLGWASNKVSSDYFGKKNTVSEMDLGVSNLGFVVTNTEANNSAWKYINWGFAYNRIADFNYSYDCVCDLECIKK